eukprot:GHVN01055290.1.p1 GENE.GHVN01055290.1~~GHVN01055290.1.p1  ORF type:complete len:625 (+),score=124.16 GHVN01055290.1:406-2280(+)
MDLYGYPQIMREHNHLIQVPPHSQFPHNNQYTQIVPPQQSGGRPLSAPPTRPSIGPISLSHPHDLPDKASVNGTNRGGPPSPSSHPSISLPPSPSHHKIVMSHHPNQSESGNAPHPTSTGISTEKPHKPYTGLHLNIEKPHSPNAHGHLYQPHIHIRHAHHHSHPRTVSPRSSELVKHSTDPNTPSTMGEASPGKMPTGDQGSAPSSPSSLSTPKGMMNLDLRTQYTDRNVFVFHLPSDWNEVELEKEFGRFGSIISSKVVKRPDHSSKGYGFVCYQHPQSASDSVEEMNGYEVPDKRKRLKVSLKKTPEACLAMQVSRLLETADEKKTTDSEEECTLFVFHLPSSWQDEDLWRHFESWGSLIGAKVAKKEDETSRGYGFVTYRDPKGAALAITSMNGVEVGSNKRLKVQLKHVSNATPHPLPGCTIFVFHLPKSWLNSTLKQHFNHCGKIQSATVQRDGSGASKGYGFVSFTRPEEATAAVSGMNGFSVGHKRLKVSLKKGEESGQVRTERYIPSTTPPYPFSAIGQGAPFFGSYPSGGQAFPALTPTPVYPSPYTPTDYTSSPSHPSHPSGGAPSPWHQGGGGSNSSQLTHIVGGFPRWSLAGWAPSVPGVVSVMMAQTPAQ